MWGRRTEPESSTCLRDASPRIDTQNENERAQEPAAEVRGPSVVRAKLLPEGIPGNEARPSQVAHPVGEPDVDVEGEWRALEEAERSQVDRDRASCGLLEELAAEDDSRLPGGLLCWILGRPPEVVLAGNHEAAAGACSTRTARFPSALYPHQPSPNQPYKCRILGSQVGAFSAV